jgi:FAD/FMN-containing dehydrogenase
MSIDRGPISKPVNPSSFDGLLVNDLHSRLNATRVSCIEEPRSLEEICRVVRHAEQTGTPVSICGGRHAMGGQQFGAGTLLLDLSRCARIHGLDTERGLVKADAGIRWPELIAGLHALQKGSPTLWSIRQKQTGADELSLGGALSANVHGRALCRPPIIADVESFTLVDAQGEARACSRQENADLFRLAICGYGAFGVIADVTLRLALRRKLERRVEIIHAEELMGAFNERIASGYLFGDFQFSADEGSSDFLKRGVFSCYRPVEDSRPMPTQQARLEAADWERLLYLAHTDRRQAFEQYSRHYLATDGQLYWSDTHQLSVYVDGYHAEIDRRLNKGCPGSEMIAELYVPRPALGLFLAEAAETLRERAATVIYGTVRLIERDEESFLAWAKEPFACVIFNLHVDHLPAAVDEAARTFRALTDLAAALGGSFYLTYHRWATRAQMDACYPQFGEFLSLQRQHDPTGRWRSDWLRHYQRMYLPGE